MCNNYIVPQCFSCSKVHLTRLALILTVLANLFHKSILPAIQIALHDEIICKPTEHHIAPRNHGMNKRKEPKDDRLKEEYFICNNQRPPDDIRSKQCCYQFIQQHSNRPGVQQPLYPDATLPHCHTLARSISTACSRSCHQANQILRSHQVHRRSDLQPA